MRRELEALERRLAQLDRDQIKPAWVEGRRWINDASAYAHHLRERISRATEHDRAAIEARIAQLRAVVGRDESDQPDDSSSS